MGIAAFCGRVRQKMLDRVSPAVWRRLVKRDVITLYYHMVSDQILPHMQTTPLYKDVEQFEADVTWLQAHGTVISDTEVAAIVAGNRTAPMNGYHITFDDGFREWFDLVRPVMLKRDVRATFFVATDFIDNQQLNWVQKKGVCVDAARRHSGDAIADTLRILNQTHRLNLQSRRELVEWLCRIDQRRLDELNHATDLLQIDVDEYLRVYRPYLSADQIRQLASEGFVIGAHSRKHHIIGELADRNEMADEIVESCRIIRDLTGRKQVPFAFPFHGRNVDREWLAALRREHDFIGLFYDTDMFKRDTADVINRVPADWPKGSVPGKSNLPFLLSRAYQG